MIKFRIHSIRFVSVSSVHVNAFGDSLADANSTAALGDTSIAGLAYAVNLLSRLLVQSFQRIDSTLLQTSDQPCISALRRSVCHFVFPLCDTSCSPQLPCAGLCTHIGGNCRPALMGTCDMCQSNAALQTGRKAGKVRKPKVRC